MSLCQSRQGVARQDKAASAWRSVISLWTDIKIVIIVRVVGSCLGMTLIERLQIRQALPRLSHYWSVDKIVSGDPSYFYTWTWVLYELHGDKCIQAPNIRGSDLYNSCRSFHDSGRTIEVILKVAKRRDWIKVISIVHGCEQYLVSRFNREIVWQLDSKADSIAATLLSLCS